MYRRPLSISIVGWILILYGLFCFAQTLWIWLGMADIPEYKHVYGLPGHSDVKQTATILIGIVIAVHVIDALFDICIGMWILGGISFARFLYAGACLLELGYQIYMSEPLMDFLPVNILEGIVILILFLPGANAYFSSE